MSSTEPILGRCYRYTTNKLYLGEYLGKHDTESWSGGHGGHGQFVKTTYYKFTKHTIGPAQLDIIEETPCEVAEAGAAMGGAGVATPASAGRQSGSGHKGGRRSKRHTRRHKHRTAKRRSNANHKK